MSQLGAFVGVASVECIGSLSWNGTRRLHRILVQVVPWVLYAKTMLARGTIFVPRANIDLSGVVPANSQPEHNVIGKSVVSNLSFPVVQPKIKQIGSGIIKNLPDLPPNFRRRVDS